MLLQRKLELEVYFINWKNFKGTEFRAGIRRNSGAIFSIILKNIRPWKFFTKINKSIW